jgi:hypothetical protein
MGRDRIRDLDRPRGLPCRFQTHAWPIRQAHIGFGQLGPCRIRIELITGSRIVDGETEAAALFTSLAARAD